MTVLEKNIIKEYVAYFKKRRLDQEPTEAQLENFRKDVMPYIKFYVQRGMGIRHAIKKYHEGC
jgi:hypothetical protein